MPLACSVQSCVLCGDELFNADSLPPLDMHEACAVVQFAGVLVSLWCVDASGRRPLMLWGGWGCTAALGALALGDALRSFPLILAAMCAFLFAFSASYGAVPPPAPLALPSGTGCDASLHAPSRSSWPPCAPSCSPSPHPTVRRPPPLRPGMLFMFSLAGLSQGPTGLPPCAACKCGAVEFCQLATRLAAVRAADAASLRCTYTQH